jgi:peptide/nickel transport system permease protein
MSATGSAPLPQTYASQAWRLGTALGSVRHSYLAGRLLSVAVTLFSVVTLSFFLIRLMPGNPITIYISQLITVNGMTYAEAQARAAALTAIDLNAPLWKQYLSYLGSLLHGNLGNSIFSQGTTVGAIILRFLPWTLFSVGLALLISFALGVSLGMITAYRRESWLDHLLSAVGSVFSSIPDYLLAIMLVVFLGVRTRVLPIAAMRGALSPGVTVGFNLHFLGDALFHAALPILTYVLASTGRWMLTMKSSTVATLGEDYVTVARAKGLADGRITTAYVGRNAIIPLVTQFAISLGFVVGGAALIETFFVYQGIGNVLITAINQRDYPVMQGVFLVISCAVILASLFADLLYGIIDPRIRISNRR